MHAVCQCRALPWWSIPWRSRSDVSRNQTSPVQRQAKQRERVANRVSEARKQQADLVENQRIMYTEKQDEEDKRRSRILEQKQETPLQMRTAVCA